MFCFTLMTLVSNLKIEMVLYVLEKRLCKPFLILICQCLWIPILLAKFLYNLWKLFQLFCVWCDGEMSLDFTLHFLWHLRTSHYLEISHEMFRDVTGDVFKCLLGTVLNNKAFPCRRLEWLLPA